jgi:hypothetical protein
VTGEPVNEGAGVPSSRQRSSGATRLVAVLKRAGAAVVVAVLLGWVVWRAWQDAQQLEWEGLRIRPGLLAGSVACMAGALFFQGVLWVVMMRGWGYGLGWVAGMRACVVSLLGNYIPGKVFVMVVRAQVARQHGLPGLPVASSVVLETALRNLVAAVVAALGLHWLGLGRAYLLGLVAFLVISVIVAHPAVFHPLINYLLRKLGREPLPARLSAHDLVTLLLGYLVFWGLYAGGFCLMAYATMGTEVHRGAGLVVSVLMAQIGSTLAVFAPAGLGVADATVEGVLRLTGAVAAAGVLAVVTRVWRTAAEMTAIGIAWALGAGRGDQEPTAEETE